MSRKLLIETHTINYTPTILTESVNAENGNMIVEGILATCEVKNGNGRYYSKELWEREMEKCSFYGRTGGVLSSDGLLFPGFSSK